jgi:GT2 family glycosyltransferase
LTIDVSIVIPTCHRNEQLSAAIASVQRQSAVALEIIVVDDSAEGAARSVVEGFGDPRITYLSTTKPTGGIPSVVRNLGWSHTVGTFVHFLDDDDIVPDGHYHRALEVFARRPDVGLVFGRVEPFGDCPPAQLLHERTYFEDAARRARSCQNIGTKRILAGQMLFANPLLVCSAGILRRTAVERVGGFDPQIRLMEDADFYLRVMRECGAACMDDTSLHYRIGFPSLMHAAKPSAEQIQAQHDGRRLMQAKYRARYGVAEFYLLAAVTRILMRRL